MPLPLANPCKEASFWGILQLGPSSLFPIPLSPLFGQTWRALLPGVAMDWQPVHMPHMPHRPVGSGVVHRVVRPKGGRGCPAATAPLEIGFVGLRCLLPTGLGMLLARPSVFPPPWSSPQLLALTAAAVQSAFRARNKAI